MYDFESIRQDAINLFDDSGWVRWIHDWTKPAYTNEDRKKNIVYARVSNHCAKCLNINGCCFPKNNMPEFPLHPKCHCRLEPVDNLLFEAECPKSKFEDYIFHPTRNRGKKVLFESWGYSIIDSKWLQQEFCRQAKEKYANGEFELGKLNEFGQRISIEITLPRKDKAGTVTFISGWMVYPDGKIINTTPYGDE